MTLPAAVAIPRQLGGPVDYIRFSFAVGPRNIRASDRKTEEDSHDVALLLADAGQQLGDDVEPVNLDSAEFCDINKLRPGEVILATHGYPADGQAVEYDSLNIKTLAAIMPGT